MGQSERMRGSAEYMAQASRVIPRGVTSYRRSALRPHPLVVASASGARLIDVDGTEYIDYVAAYGPMFLGHQRPEVLEAVTKQLEIGVLYGAQHRLEVALAQQIIDLVPSAEQVLFNVSGTEADHAAIRLARAATGRSKVLKFEGHYHGWIDPLTANGAGTNADSTTLPRPIIAPGYADIGTNLLVCPWDDIASLTEVMRLHGHEIAAIIMEPIAINGGNLGADDGYLEQVRQLCDEYGTVLIFDEVITGFRVAAGGAQELSGVTPDLTVLAKALGSGFPISAVAGKRDIMEAAVSKVGHGGTYNGNTISMAAAQATLNIIAAEGHEMYPRVQELTDVFAAGILDLATAHGVPLQVRTAPSVVRMHWSDTPIRSYPEVLRADAAPLARLGEALMLRGLHVRENGLWYLSAAHTRADIDDTLRVIDEVLPSISSAR